MLSMNDDHEAIDHALVLFSILSNKTRLKIVLLLSEKEMNVKELEQATTESQSSISHQLSLMRHLNLVKAKRIGREHYYRVTDTHIEHLLQSILIHLAERKI